MAFQPYSDDDEESDAPADAAAEPGTRSDAGSLARRAVDNPGLHVLAGLGGWLLAGLLVGLLAAWMVFYHYSQDLPGFGKLTSYEPPVVTRLYAGDGKLLAEYAMQKRNYVPLVSIPKRVQMAFLAAEDKNFYTHPGIDLTGVGRAVLTNIVHKGHSPVGGSTITQQVVKNFLLTNEKTFERKVKEAILSVRITQSFSKSRILELYLNEIYLGAGSYGIAAAALNYFDKSVDDLTIEEAAMLAALPKAPRSYDPRRHMDNAKIRRDWVIGRMREDGVIDAEEAAAATATPITLRRRSTEDTARADFFAEEVRRQLAQRYGANVLYEGGLYVKTTLQPTLQRYADAGLRKALVAYDRRHGWRGALRRIELGGDWHASLSALPRNGIHLLENQQLAVVRRLTPAQAEIGLEDGSEGAIALKDMAWARRELGPLALGPALSTPAQALAVGDIVLAQRLDAAEEDAKPTAEKSTEKPVEKPGRKAKAKDEPKLPRYSLQQEPQVNGAMVVMDVHTGQVLALSGGYAYGDTEFNRATQARRQPGSSFKPFAYLAALEAGLKPNSIVYDAPIELPQGPGLPNWRPSNYTDDFLGPATLRTGLEQSRNLMTVRMAQQIGLGRALEMSERFGVYKKVVRNYSAVLGSQETTLLNLTNAYAMLANGGLRVGPSLIERIDDRHGRVVYKRDARDCLACVVAPNQPGALPAMPDLPESRERIVDAALDYQLVHMLEGVVERGTATKAKILGRPLAGKTGTTNDSRDTWFVGFTPDLVVGTYIGFDQPRSLGKKETGGGVALPGFIAFMQEAMKDVPPQPFAVPPGIRFVAIDRKSGVPLPGYAVVDPYAQTAADAPAPAATPVEDEPGVDEAPADAAQEGEPPAASVVPAAPALASSALPAKPAPATPLPLRGAPPSPAPGVIMEAFRPEALPTVTPAAAPTLPWLMPQPGGPPTGELPPGSVPGGAGFEGESPLNRGLPTSEPTLENGIYSPSAGRVVPSDIPMNAPPSQQPAAPLSPSPPSALPPSAPGILGNAPVQWQQPPANRANQPNASWGRRDRETAPAPSVEIAPQGTGGLY